MSENALVEMPTGLEEIDIEMSNFDHHIDEDGEARLKAGGVFARHAGWNFNGTVWWDGSQFCEAVWQYHSHVATLTAPTLRELMTDVNDEYGWA